MKVIKLDQFRTAARGAVARPIIRLRANGQISITKSVVGKLKIQDFEFDDKKNALLHVSFAEDDDSQLHIKVSNSPSEESITFTEKDGLFVKSNVKLSRHLIEYTKSEAKSIPCLVQVESQNEDGWMPVITTYWKTL